MSLTLKPCPFCGGDAQSQWSFGAVYVECKLCGAQQANSSGIGGDEIEAIAISKWNRRADMALSAQPGHVAVPMVPPEEWLEKISEVIGVEDVYSRDVYDTIIELAAAEGKK